MRLKRVRIFGFKTFADRTEFDIDGGIVAVVGPNGCGKSNLVDAILWGLGEGNARQLRAQTGIDVIFGGSSRRKSLGFAEVTLLFDNEDGILPIESSEVSITRKLTKSGDSDYSINRQSCRLRDIFDLLADTGLGRTGYSIVGQKEIDQALAASPEDRRAWVDEAAGVQRYRARKNEALKRLAAAQQHMQRVNDLLRELEVQRDPLREEAEVARKYRTAQNSLREVEVGLLIEELVKSIRETEELEGRIAESQKLAAEENSRAEEAESASTAIGEKAAGVEREIELLWSVQQRALTAQERAESDLRLAEQKLEGLADMERSLEEEAALVEQRIKDARHELEVLEKEEREDREALERLREECAGAGEEAKRLMAELQAIEKVLRDAREIHARKLRVEAEEAHRKERIVQLKREIAGIQKTLPDLEAAAKEATDEFEKRQASHSGIDEQIAAIENGLVDARKVEEQDAQAARKWMADRAALDGRRRGIEATIESHEGLNQGARAVLEAAGAKKLHGSFTPVGEAVETDKELALAIETALGGAVNDLIVDDPQEAKEAIAWLKENRAGRATFQPIPLMRPSEPSSDLKRLLNERGVVGRASELVRCQAKHRPVIDSLLGRVVVVESIDDALKLAKTGGWSRLVTTEGEVVHSGGAVTGGRTSKQSYGLVQRKADLAELQHAIKDLDKKLADAEKRSAKRHGEREEAYAKATQLREQQKGLSTELKEAQNFARELHDELQSTIKSQTRLSHELEVLVAKEPDQVEQVDIHGLEANRDSVLKELASKSADAESAEDRLREANARLQQAEIRLAAGRKRVQASQDAEEHRQRKLFHLEPDRERLRNEIEQHRLHRQKADGERQQAEQRLDVLKKERQAFVEEALRLAEDARQARANATTVVQGVHQAELNRARAETRRASTAERLMEEYSLTEEDAMAQEGMHEVPPDAASVVQRLRRELKSMGDVNLGAIEAYERLTERVDELDAQKKDIDEGIEQVRASISELDGMTREKFQTTFLAVQASFTELFAKLFGGGEGHLSLTDTDSILDSGIDIEVTLPGKKRQRLELLSGGERSLCACAFLFSLLKVKPSPLVVLDEVDAPLDGRNVERFVSLLNDFASTTQFIVVTHNPVTIEAAPVWLGVTMQEPGVSTLVPTKVAMGAPTPATHAVVGEMVPSPA